jgi:hypothetical protein
MLLHGERIIGAALYGGIVGDDHAFAPFDAADAGDQSGGMNGLVVQAVRGKRRQFEKWRAGIDQRHHAVARQQLAARHMTLARLGRTAARGLRTTFVQFSDQRLDGRGVGEELIPSGGNGRCDASHARSSMCRKWRDFPAERTLMEHRALATKKRLIFGTRTHTEAFSLRPTFVGANRLLSVATPGTQHPGTQGVSK